MTGSSSSAQQQELAKRVQRTLNAAQQAAPTMFRAHINGVMQHFEASLVTAGKRYRQVADPIAAVLCPGVCTKLYHLCVYGCEYVSSV